MNPIPSSAGNPIAIPLSVPGPFNRYTLTFRSNIPFRGLLAYRVGGEPRTEEFFLEAGDARTFSCLIEGFLQGESADCAEGLTLFPLRDEPPAFELTDFSVGTAAIPDNHTYYFENDRYRIGVELSWGGGLSYLSDKACPVEGLDNLLNRHDAGRLIQQSYYGTDQPPFVCGSFGGNDRWPYNPVQGGDRGAHKSRLVDFRIGEKEVYVKCRPRDWGKDGGNTFAYMENVYRLDGDFCVVDNRFVDFSGYTHQPRTQELPAFYTVSYLNNYYFYEGDKPWTDAPLSVRSDLPFWASDWDRCTFTYAPENTETWGAFVDDQGYGLGLYTPNTYRWLAGRNAYDGSRDGDADSCNYIAPTRSMCLHCFEPITYSYLIAAGFLQDIRRGFRERRDFADNRSLNQD